MEGSVAIEANETEQLTPGQVRKEGKGELRTVYVQNSHWMKWGPAEAMLYFDAGLVLTLAIGWASTALGNPQAIHDNSILKVFGVYNICIGVDTFPARFVCPIVFALSIPFVVLSSYLHWLKIYFDGGMPLWLATSWLTISTLLIVTFSQCFAIAPVNAHDFWFHTAFFGTACLGLGSLKAFVAYKFKAFDLYDKKDVKGQIYFWSMVAQAVVLIAGFLGLCFSIKDWEWIQGQLAKESPDRRDVDWGGNVLVLVFGIGPILQWVFVPAELRNTAHIIDATQAGLSKPP